MRAAEPLGFDGRLWERLRAMGAPDMALEASLDELAVVCTEAGRHLAPVPLVEALVATRVLGQAPDGVPTVALHASVDGRWRLVPAGAIADVVVGVHEGALVQVRRPPPMAAPSNLGSMPVADVAVVDPQPLDRHLDLDEWRLLTAAALVGLARGALDLGVAYATTRHQFGVPIGSFQAIQHSLADVAVALDGATAALEERSPVALLVAAEAAHLAAHTCVHVHGGYGYMVEYDAQLFYRRAKAWPLVLGDLDAELDRDVAVPTPTPPVTIPSEVVERVRATGTVHDWDLHREFARRGWLALDRDPADDADLREQLALVGAPIDGWGTAEVAVRAIMAVGTAEQQDLVVPRFLRGELLIALGYSEPDSGSDVAAARTRAVRDGDEWVIDGQKMFTSFAHEASYVFLLTRTNPDVPKHRGLTMFLVPLDHPGVEIREVRTMGNERTNVTFYNEVRVPDSARVGDVDGGWDVMRVALAFDRQAAAHADLVRLLDRARAWAAERGRTEDPHVRRRLNRIAVDTEVARLLGRKLRAARAAGELAMVEGSIAKLFASEAFQRATASVLDLTAPDGLLAGWAEEAHRQSAVRTVQAGTSEIQRSIIAEQRLGLPRSR